MRKKHPQIKTRKKCRSCSSSNLTEIMSLGKQYLSDFSSANKKVIKSSLALVLCDDCSLLQLKHTVPAELLYTERYGYKSGINNTMKRELKEIANKSLSRLGKKKNITVVDIGANDGTLLDNYSGEIFKIGIEPISKFAKECSRRANVVINDFFNYSSFFKKLKSKKADIVTVISCFYDMEQPNEVISDIKKILHKDGIIVIQQNYLVGMLKQNAFDNVVHEHLEYYSLLSLENLLSKHGLDVFDVEESGINGGSFRTYIARNGQRIISKAVKDMREAERKLDLENIKIYKKFAERVSLNGENLHKLILKLSKNNKKIFVYGASTRGNTLLQYTRLNSNLIKVAVERNPEKWGKKISSVGIPIISEEQARREKPDYMLVLPWFFKKEFLQREKKYLKSGGHFIFPLPKLEII